MRVKAAFTLLELLCAIAVMALLTAIAIPATRARYYVARTKSVSNLRQLGVAARLYANEHEQRIPGQASPAGLPLPGLDGSSDPPWPSLLVSYLSPSDPRVLVDPLDPAAAKLTASQILSSDSNHTGYLYNGFDDLSEGGSPLREVPLTAIDSATNVVLMSQKTRGAKPFYATLLTAPLDLLLSALDLGAYDGGSNYLYLDGSVRFIKQDQYNNNIWLVHKDQLLPPPGGSSSGFNCQPNLFSANF